MAEITTSGSDADLSFEARWEKALGQPEVSIADAKKLTIDASPLGDPGSPARAGRPLPCQGRADRAGLRQHPRCSDQLEQAFSAVAPPSCWTSVGALKARLRGGPPK